MKGHPYEQGFDLRLVPAKLAEPLRWRTPKMIFVNSMSDLFHDLVPDAYIVAVTRVMAAANWHTYRVLTKRSERLRQLPAHTLVLPQSSRTSGGVSAWRTENTGFRASITCGRLPLRSDSFPSSLC